MGDKRRRTAAPARRGAGMAATDPTTRREAAVAAARARVAGMSPAERQAMTAAARETQRATDLRAVDDEARRLGQHPLDPETRAFRLGVLTAARARKASVAAGVARRRREALAADLRLARRILDGRPL